MHKVASGVRCRGSLNSNGITPRRAEAFIWHAVRTNVCKIAITVSFAVGEASIGHAMRASVYGDIRSKLRDNGKVRVRGRSCVSNLSDN